jgi:hypothetical protein
MQLIINNSYDVKQNSIPVRIDDGKIIADFEQYNGVQLGIFDLSSNDILIDSPILDTQNILLIDSDFIAEYGIEADYKLFLV